MNDEKIKIHRTEGRSKSEELYRKQEKTFFILE